jgi:hypothetical protein
VSPAYHLHPEFGLLCPSPSFRRKARLVFALLVIAGLLASKALHRPDTDTAFVVAHDDEARFNTEAAQTVGETTATTTADRSRPLEGSKPACVGDAWSYFDGKCSVGTARKLPRPRAANEVPTIAALPLGRSALPTLASSVAPLSSADANTAAPTPAPADRAGAPASAPRKVQKQTHRNSGPDLLPDHRWRDDQWSARAYAIPDDRYLRGRYERSWGWGQIR